MLTGRRILLISPQPWSHLPVSKHHYAMELARRGASVVFLQPPESRTKRDVFVAALSEVPGVSLVRFQLRVPQILRFHARPLYDRLMRREIRRLTDAIGRDFDLVWSFEPNLYADLRRFGGRRVIFHPVDALSRPDQLLPARSADLILTVSGHVKERLAAHGLEAVFIHHGLAEPFARHAREARPITRPTGRPRVGYVGNLMHPAVDRAAFRAVIEGNEGAEFHVWGPYVPAERDAAAVEFIEFLQASDRVVLHGPVRSDALADACQHMDAFLLAYGGGHATYDLSNSHKVLEYLSTGRVVISSVLAAYQSCGDLLLMPPTGNNTDLPALLREALANLDMHNSEARAAGRRSFALGQTYDRQVDRVLELMGERHPNTVRSRPDIWGRE